MSKYYGAVIADVHVGASNLEKLHNEFSEVFIKELEEMKKLDYLIIDGDFFDKKFFINDPEAQEAYIMLKEILLLCKKKNAVVRIVYGTESHDCNQYYILSLLKIYDKVRVIKTAEEEELLPGLNILYLPEEHIYDKREWYKDFFINDKKYDYVFGHGIIREAMKEAALSLSNNDDKKNKRAKVPVFNSEELKRICKGQVFFGHYHINYENDNVFYVGSFSRWKFGEEERKGFYTLECDTEKNKYKEKFIENTLADAYTTITFGYDNKIFNSENDLNESLKEVDALIERRALDHVRFMFNVPTDVENPEATINYLKEKYKYHDKVKLNIVHGYIEEKRKQQKEKVLSENQKYDFIFEDMEIEDKVNKFISIEYNSDVKKENIHRYIFDPLNEIINNTIDE